LTVPTSAGSHRSLIASVTTYPMPDIQRMHNVRVNEGYRNEMLSIAFHDIANYRSLDGDLKTSAERPLLVHLK
jgi:hypothetical protein